MTDDLSMKALSGDFAERTEKALAAGCDIILHCNGDRDEMAAIAGVLPPNMTGKTAERGPVSKRRLPVCRAVSMREPKALGRTCRPCFP